MSTRGFVGWVIDEKVVITYNHSDSYPSYLGKHVLEFLRSGVAPTLREKLKQVRLVDDDVAGPTPAEREQYKQFFQQVSGGDDWYAVLRDLQGDLRLILEAGITPVVGEEWAYNSLFCEWGYLVDLDENVFEVYKGMQTRLPILGRWAGIPSDDGYFPVSRARSWHLDELPDDDTFDRLKEQYEQEQEAQRVGSD